MAQNVDTSIRLIDAVESGRHVLVTVELIEGVPPSEGERCRSADGTTFKVWAIGSEATEVRAAGGLVMTVEIVAGELRPGQVFAICRDALTNVNDYIGRPRDSRRERELQRQLRAMTPDEAFALISEFIARDPTVGLELARRCLRDPVQFEQILQHGLERAAGKPSA